MTLLRWGLTIAGSLVGLVFGIILGMIGVFATLRAEWAKAGFKPAGMVGIDVRVFLRSQLFWSLVVISTLGLGFLAGRIGDSH